LPHSTIFFGVQYLLVWHGFLPKLPTIFFCGCKHELLRLTDLIYL